MENISTAEARKHLADLLNRAAYGKERFVVTRHGKELVAIVPAEDLELLERLRQFASKKEIDAALRELVTSLSSSPHLEGLRIHTRAPVHDPARVTPELAAALASGLPARVVLHYNHPREITAETPRVVSTFLAAGLLVLNQSVLLAGVNDDPETLETLCRSLHRERIQPYYLHHPDPAPGTGAFYLDPERGLVLYRELERRLAGAPALPRYVIDPPDGSGKVPVESYLRG